MKLNVKRTFLVGLAFMSISIFWSVYDNAVPLILKNTFGLNATVTGTIMAADNILALFMLPLFGLLSDKTNTRIGRRMPYILVGTAFASISALLLPVADNIGSAIFFIIALAVVLLSMASYRSPAVALMPDVTPKPLRSKGNAIINLMGALGGAIVMALTGFLVSSVEGQKPNYFNLFLFVSLFMVVTVTLLYFTVNEPKSVAEMRKRSLEMGIDEEETVPGSDEPVVQEKLSPAVRKSFILILVSIFLWFMGYNAVISTFSRYAEAMWGIELGGVMNVLLVAQVAAIIMFIPVGLIATKIGRKKTILCGIILLAAAFGCAMLFQTLSVFIFALFALAGFGWAFINVNSLPMVVDMSKGANVGQYTGYYYFSSTAAQIITPILSGAFIDRLGYQVLFPYACIFVALSFATMLFVRHGDTRPQPAQSKLEAFDIDD